MPNNEFGDFQTPLELAQQCLSIQNIPADARILEPTCGKGSFLHAASLTAAESERVGIELKSDYAKEAANHGLVLESNIFDINLSEDVKWRSDGPLVVIGNPPWVTSAELNRMDSSNLPKKENFKGARGLNAILGSSNFDVCEYIILKIINELRTQPFSLGMLCKTQVARNVIEYAASANFPIVESAIYRINAMKWFNAGVDACWFTITIEPARSSRFSTAVYDELSSTAAPTSSFGVVDGKLVSDIDRYKAVKLADGKSPYVWRSGLKHDASKVFELVASPGPETRAGEVLDLEPEYLFPLLKSTDIFRGRHESLSKWVIVPQKTFAAETDSLRTLAPKLWRYLTGHGAALDGRKSSIYRNQPRFAVFGHGPYSFAPYKVAISGLHKTPIFRLVSPISGKPVILDDTCYFVPFEDATEAAMAWALMNSEPCQALIESLAFWDSKRPVTKKLLSRIDINRLPVDPQALIEVARTEAERIGLDFSSETAESFFEPQTFAQEATLF